MGLWGVTEHPWLGGVEGGAGCCSRAEEGSPVGDVDHGGMPAGCYQDGGARYDLAHRSAHPCGDTTLREDILAALGEAGVSHRPVSFSNFATSRLAPGAGAVLGRRECSCADAEKTCNPHRGEQKLAPGGAFL